ncbi:MAG TPA: hypothetical protein VMP03_12145 [Methylomirabilota bacterium]|nr:hypothetical protein [Methylomirabilota bacterium]
MIECIVMTADLMAEVRVLEALRAAGLTARAAGSEAWALEMAAAADPSGDAGPPTIGVVDLTAPDAVAAIERAADAGVPVVAYGPHVDGDALAAARAAGATAVYPRGRFLMQTAALVRGLVAQDESGGGVPKDSA